MGEAVFPSFKDGWPSTSVRFLNDRVVVAVDPGQDGMVEGGGRAVWAFCWAAAVLAALAAEDLSEGGAHLFVAVGVDDGVHSRVELSQEKKKFLIGQNITLGAAHVEQ